MKKSKFIIYAAFAILLMVACNSKKSGNGVSQSDVEDVMVSDSMRPEMPPPPPDGKHPGGPPPPPDGKGHPLHKPDNMRGFDPASEDDMDDNGMSRYMENNDDEGWD